MRSRCILFLLFKDAEPARTRHLVHKNEGVDDERNVICDMHSDFFYPHIYIKSVYVFFGQSRIDVYLPLLIILDVKWHFLFKIYKSICLSFIERQSYLYITHISLSLSLFLPFYRIQRYFNVYSSIYYLPRLFKWAVYCIMILHFVLWESGCG